MKKRVEKKHHIHLNDKLKKAIDYGVTAFCIANNGAYFLSQKELLQCFTRDIYYFSKDKAKKIAVFPKKHKIKIDSVKKIPKEIAHLIKRLREQ